MSELDFLAFDADNHYYEALDAFTRHLDPADGATVRAVVRDRRPQVPRGGRSGQPSRGESRRSTRWRCRGVARLLPRQPRRATPLDMLAEASRSAAARVPRPRRPRRADGAAQGLEAAWMFPTLGMIYEELLKHDLEASVADVHRPSTGGSTTTGASTTRTGSSPRPTSRCATSTGRCPSSSGRSTGRAHHRDAPGRGLDREGLLPPTDASLRPVLGRGSTRPGITVVVHAGDSGHSSNGYADESFSASFEAAGSPPSSASTSSGRPTTLLDADVRPACSTASRTCGSRRSRTAPSSCPTCSASSTPAPQDVPGYFERGSRRARSGATSGSTRSGRTTRTRSST